METIFTGDLRLKLKRASSTVFSCDRSSHRQMYLKIKQNSQKKPVLDSFLIDCRRLASNLIKKETLVLLVIYRIPSNNGFFCEFCIIFLRTTILQNTCEQLLGENNLGEKNQERLY